MTDAPRALPPLPGLPVAEAVPRLRAALAGTGTAVLAAPPGSGKTTLVPLLLLDEPWLKGQKIVMLEPRRIAARASAARMASLLGEAVGATVGYQVRFERKTSAATRIEVVTEGLLARRLQADPELPGVGLLIFDEFHERSLDADLALALALDVRANLRPELRILVMSATLDAERVATLLGSGPVVESAGRLFPVDVRYAPRRLDTEPEEALAAAVHGALQERTGDILAFLPGAREIRAAHFQIERREVASDGVDILPLYGDLSSEAQDRALRPSSPGRRKVVLATNIAQTSLTIEGVHTVVDQGLARVARFDLGAGANRLETQRVSRASADQRAGRAGRLGPGVAIRLWSRDEQAQRPAHDLPEILVADLSRLALELASWGVRDPGALSLLDAPPASAWSYAIDLLRRLGAIDGERLITAHGRLLASLPASPRIAHMLVTARELGQGPLGAWTAAALEERSSGSDLSVEVQRFLAGRAPDANAQRRVRDTVRQMLRMARIDDEGTGPPEGVGAMVALAYPERIARRREAQTQAREVSFHCVDGGEARLSAGDGLATSPWLAIAHWDPGAPRRIRSAAAVDEAALRAQHADLLQAVDAVHWDPRIEAVVAERQLQFGAIVLERRPLRDAADTRLQEQMRTALLEGIRSLGIAALPWKDSDRNLQARLASLAAWRPGEGWPAVDDAALLSDLEAWLGPSLDGLSRRDHLGRLDLHGMLLGRLDYARQRELDRLAPSHLEVPSGSRIGLDYTPDGAAPILAVKLQELFGLTETPTVNGGRMRVALHLLSPGKRPIQVTQDLAGFWSRTYPEVKKELKGRYPKHPWPDDPLTAPPTARAKPRVR